MLLRVLPICGLSTIFVMAIAGCGAPPDNPPVIRPVQTFTLGTAEDVPFRRFPGEISAGLTSRMSFEVPGRIIEQPATQGVTYSKGDLLSRLDPENYEARLAAAQARLTAAREELQRQTQLRERGVISQSEFDRFKEQFEVADAAQREAARALAETRMVAPFDGRVAQVLVDEFQNVTPNQPVLIFQDLDMLEVNIQVPEGSMSALRSGITADYARDRVEARIEFPTLPGQVYDLALISFSTQAEQAARTFQVTLGLKSPPGANILPGMTSTVLLRERSPEMQEETAFLVPASAVATDENGSSVWKLNLETMRVHQVPVELIAVREAMISVRAEDLHAGDEIVSAGVRFLSENMEVRRMEPR